MSTTFNILRSLATRGDVNLSHLLNASIVNTLSTCDSIASQHEKLCELSRRAEDLYYVDPDWLLMSGRIRMYALEQYTPATFSESSAMLDRYHRLQDVNYAKFVEEHASRLDAMIKPERDYNFHLLGMMTLLKSYLLRVKDSNRRGDLPAYAEEQKEGKYDINGEFDIVERPQYMYLRVATFLWFSFGMSNMDEVFENIEKCYEMLSTQQYTHASPTLFNAGCHEGSLSSCYTMEVSDTTEGHADLWRYVATISKSCGGEGISFSEVRHSEVAQRVQKTSLTNWARIVQEILRAFDQGNKRKGSAVAFLNIWHIDVERLLELREPHGRDDERARDLLTGLWIQDEFMRRVEADEEWTLFCPHTVPDLVRMWGDEFTLRYRYYEQRALQGHLHYFKRIRALTLFNKIINAQIESGTPYMLYADAVNMKSNQKNIGPIVTSNLCVSGDTLLFTNKGHLPIKDLKDQPVTIWNGHEWSDTVVRQTNEHQDLLHIKFSNGAYLDCTPYHKFYIQNGGGRSEIQEIEAKDLKVGDKLIRYELPTDFKHGDEEFPYPYTHGFFCGDGTYSNGHPTICLYNEKKQLLKHFDYRCKGNDLENRQYIRLHRNIRPKFDVPMNSSLQTKLEWLAGYMDADGTVCYKSIQIASVEKSFLNLVKLMLQTMGVDSKVTFSKGERDVLLPDGKGSQKLYKCQRIYRLLINSKNLSRLHNLGLKTYRLKYPDNLNSPGHDRYIQVSSIENGFLDQDTYCVNEPKRHMAMFNGILTSQCSEVTLHTDKDVIGSCNLASVCLPSCVEDGKFNFEKLHDICRFVVRAMDRVIDMNYCPGNFTAIVKPNEDNRPLGIGVQGLADVFALVDLSWKSPEAKQLNHDIFETMYHACISESIELAKIHGPYNTFKGSPASQGLFQFDLWQDHKLQRIASRVPKFERTLPSDRYDWEKLRQEMVTHGLRHSLLMALMPTASTSSLTNYIECFEPPKQCIFKRTVLSGSYVTLNVYCIKELMSLGLWTADTVKKVIDKGSIQWMPDTSLGTDEESIKKMKHIKEKYLSCYELPQRILIDMSSDRGQFICQSQSLNCFMAEPTSSKLQSYHLYAWKSGLKTGMYYLKQANTENQAKNFADTAINMYDEPKTPKMVCTDEICFSCSS